MLEIVEMSVKNAFNDGRNKRFAGTTAFHP